MKHFSKSINKPDSVLSYFKNEKTVLLFITISGLLYNIGMIAGPYFEGQLTQKLLDIIQKKSTALSMLFLCAQYISVIMFVQLMRSFKRFFVRRFANNVNRNMKYIVYNNIIFEDRTEFNDESAGVMMTKTISDIDACVEGMRKFTTEIFDTGVVLIVYVAMLMFYDIKLALISCIFPPLAYFFAQKLKTVIYKYTKEYKKQTEVLNNATNDRISGAILYRIYGRENAQNKKFSSVLNDYEKKAVKANVWENSMTPLYRIISSISIIAIIYIGSRNVYGTGFTKWDIASFTTFIACFTKLTAKSSRAAKLFNSVQKASVSWNRIKPILKKCQKLEADKNIPVDNIKVSNLSFSYPDGNIIFKNISFEAKKGEIIGITGPVGCGKSTLGKIFLNEYSYSGHIFIDGKELSSMSEVEKNSIISYLGHKPELISTSIKENICLGKNSDITKYTSFVCMDKEILQMVNKEETLVGNGGMQLSGGQQARLALARTIFHKSPILILDDPFSAVDRKTENSIMKNLKVISKDHIIFLISHRLELFPEYDKVIWIEHNKIQFGSHKTLLSYNISYKHMFELQKNEECNEKI